MAQQKDEITPGKKDEITKKRHAKKQKDEITPDKKTK